MRSLHTLEPIRFKYLPESEQEFVRVARGHCEPDTLIYYWIRVVPMGLSWSVHLVQEGQLQNLRSALHHYHPRLTRGRSTPQLRISTSTTMEPCQQVGAQHVPLPNP